MTLMKSASYSISCNVNFSVLKNDSSRHDDKEIDNYQKSETYPTLD